MTGGYKIVSKVLPEENLETIYSFSTCNLQKGASEGVWNEF